MISIVFYGLLIYGIIIAITPLIDILVFYIKDTWYKCIEGDKKRIKNWMDAYHRGEGNYEYYDPDKPVWNEELMMADYDKYDDPFYIGDNNEEEHKVC